MNLKSFMNEVDLTPEKLASIFNCSTGHIYNIVSKGRSLTAMQIRLLIDKYGFETVAKYAGDGEMPQGPIVNVDMSRTKIEGNQGPVQNGDGNQMTNDATLIQVLSQQSAQITELLKQQDRLISLLEKK
jgi:hypothetical protein